MTITLVNNDQSYFKQLLTKAATMTMSQRTVKSISITKTMKMMKATLLVTMEMMLIILMMVMKTMSKLFVE